MSARNSDPESSHQAAAAFEKHSGKVNERITEIVRAAGRGGRTQSQVVSLLPEYKPGSITPRFVRLVKRGELILVRVGTGKATKQFPQGRPLYVTRFDEETKCDVNLYWVPEFAPALNENGSNSAPTSVARTEKAQHDFEKTMREDTSPNL